jgi:hypothetical protein
MVREYTERFYLPAAERRGWLTAVGMALARSLAAWKERVRDQWSRVCVESVTAGPLDGVQVNSEIKAQAEVSLGALTPDDVSVELIRWVGQRRQRDRRGASDPNATGWRRRRWTLSLRDQFRRVLPERVARFHRSRAAAPC